MILSMTGYGKAEDRFRGRTLVCEVRSLNSKSMDMNVRLAPQLRSRELELRTLVAQRAVRGKVDLALFTEDTNANGQSPTPTANWEVAEAYARQYAEHFGAPAPPEVMASILRLPEVSKLREDTSELTDDEWTALLAQLNRALDAFTAFRTQEGTALQAMFTDKLDAIAALLDQVEPFEQGRVAKIRERLELNLAQLSEATRQATDRNRLEQEMIYYLEKLDITEEKVRLTNHIRYFRETMDNANPDGVGKKLGFIAQEMGREINTLGSKSNQSEMQIIVVKMKDILEQIKEQVLNVL